METCGECKYFYKIPEIDIDYEKGKGDCVLQRQDQKGIYWISTPKFQESEACEQIRQKK